MKLYKLSNSERGQVWIETEIAKKRKEEVVKLLQNMNIKKDAAGGFSKDDVYTCMQDLCNLYEANIAQMEKEYGQDIQVLQQQLNTEKRTVQQRVAAAKKEAEQEAEIKTARFSSDCRNMRPIMMSTSI